MLRIKYLVRVKVKKILYGLCLKLFPEINDKHKIKDIISAALGSSSEPIFLINHYHENLRINDKVLWSAIKEVRVVAPLAFQIMLDQHAHVSSKSLYLRLMATCIINNKTGSSDGNVRLLIDEFNASREEINEVNRVKALIASAVILNSTLFEIQARLDAIGFDIKNLTDHQKVKLMERYLANDDESFFLANRSSLGSVSQPANIKIDQMYYTLKKDSFQHFRSLETSFENLPFDISRRYSNHVKPLFNSIESNNNYTDASYSKDKISKLRKMILDSIMNCNSLSFIRLGDGESYGFRNSDYIDCNGYMRQEVHWWGETLPKKTREDLQSSFIASVESCDFLGVPTVTRLIKDFNLEKKDSYAQNSLISRIFCVMTSSPAFFKDKIVVEDQINLYIFNQRFIEDIFDMADKVVFISGVNQRVINQWAPASNKLECMEIPTHRLLREKSVASSAEGILPNVYRGYLHEIKELAGPGVVFIVSAGFIGKIFIAEAAKHGSVALDIGQTLVSLVEKRD